MISEIKNAMQTTTRSLAYTNDKIRKHAVLQHKDNC